jgi:AraC-like DNA-binding protein
VLRAAIPAGHAKAEQVAAPFSMHSHTLNRRVKALGTSYQELLDERRFEVARQSLKDSRMEISEIAAMLDVADARSFIRAFRHWSGTTRARWRENVAATRRSSPKRGSIRVSSPSRTAIPLRGPIR